MADEQARLVINKDIYKLQQNIARSLVFREKLLKKSAKLIRTLNRISRLIRNELTP